MDIKITKDSAKNMFLLNNKDLENLPYLFKDNYHNLSRKIKLYSYDDLKNKSNEKFGDIEILVKLKDERKNKKDNLLKKKKEEKTFKINKILSIISNDNNFYDLDEQTVLNEFPVICYIENDLKELKKTYSNVDIKSDNFIYTIIKNACDRIRRRIYIKNIYNNKISNIDNKLINEYISKGSNKELVIEGKSI